MASLWFYKFLIDKRYTHSHVKRDVQETLPFKTMLLGTRYETLSDGILVTDVTGKAILYNTQFSEICEMPLVILESEDDKKWCNGYISKSIEPERFIDHIRQFLPVES